MAFQKTEHLLFLEFRNNPTKKPAILCRLLYSEVCEVCAIVWLIKTVKWRPTSYGFSWKNAGSCALSYSLGVTEQGERLAYFPGIMALLHVLCQTLRGSLVSSSGRVVWCLVVAGLLKKRSNITNLRNTMFATVIIFALYNLQTTIYNLQTTICIQESF